MALGARAARTARYRQLDEQVRSNGRWPPPSCGGRARIHPGARPHAVIGAVFRPDAVYTADGGNPPRAGQFSRRRRGRARTTSILELGNARHRDPQAIGAKLGRRERDVVCVTGDGAAGFNVMELQTAVREGVDVTVTVCAEGSWDDGVQRIASSTERRSAQARVRSAGTFVAQKLAASAYVDRMEGS